MSSASEQLVEYLTDAHAMEEQSLQTLEAAVEIAGDVDISQLYRGHITETKEQKRFIEERLEQLGESPSRLKDAGGRAAALGLGALAGSLPDTPGRLAAVAYAYEHLEIAAYEQLKRVAERAGDSETEAMAERILTTERDAAAKIARILPLAADRSLEAKGVQT